MPSLASLLLTIPALLLAGGWARERRLLRRAEAARAEAERAAASCTRQIGLFAREFRGCSLSLLGHVERLRARPEARDEAAAMSAVVRQVLEQSDELADFASDRSGNCTLAEESVPLQPLLQEVTALVATLLRPGCRHWRIAPELAEATLLADRRAVAGVLSQVLTRAARLSQDGDWIDLRLVLTPETAALVVEDEGAGAGGEDLRVGNAAGEGAGTRGIGFGLAQARRLMRAHGGELALEAVPGIGTRAWLTLPRDRVAVPPPRPDAVPSLELAGAAPPDAG